MNRENLKQKIKKSLRWIYQNDATQGDRLLLYATNNLIAYEPFFINRHSANLDEFINSATDYLFHIDKDNSVLIRVAEFPINISGFQTFPSDYAQIINTNVSGRTAEKSSGSSSTSGGGGGSGIINIGSLEGLGSILFTPKETVTSTTTTTTPSQEVVKQSSTTTIVIVIVAVLLIALLIFFLNKKV
jgi:hypothetical protein